LTARRQQGWASELEGTGTERGRERERERERTGQKQCGQEQDLVPPPPSRALSDCVLCRAVLGLLLLLLLQGSWQGSLLTAGEPLGTCTLNTPDCGKVGKQCCREDVPESGSVKICESKQRPGSHYCDADNICAKCPDVPTTKEQKEECRGLGQQAEESGSNPFSTRGGGRVSGARG
jgi:hypothetical protein